MALANDGAVGLTNRFKVRVMPADIDLGYWAKIEGLKMPDVRTGDNGNSRIYAPGYTTYPDVKLTRSANPTDSPKVQAWLAQNSSKHAVGEVVIELHGPNNDKPVLVWECKESLPIEWSIAAFDASSSNLAMETLIFTHNGFLEDDFKIE
jgi:phage tail-like protein